MKLVGYLGNNFCTRNEGYICVNDANQRYVYAFILFVKIMVTAAYLCNLIASIQFPLKDERK